MNSRARENNNNWRGGRSIASNGYILVRVGTDHHLSDVRGYAYEHRIKAEEKIGRRLIKGEQVHHIDGNKQNNDLSNIEVLTSHEHNMKHRKRDKGLRRPGEQNPKVSCECGCGITFDRFDRQYRPRRFIPGHNIHPIKPK